MSMTKTKLPWHVEHSVTYLAAALCRKQTCDNNWCVCFPVKSLELCSSQSSSAPFGHNPVRVKVWQILWLLQRNAATTEAVFCVCTASEQSSVSHHRQSYISNCAMVLLVHRLLKLWMQLFK